MARRRFRLLLRDAKLGGGHRGFVLRLLTGAHLLLERGSAPGRIPHLHKGAAARDEQEHVLEHDPGGVLHPSPLAGHQHAIDRLRPEVPAQHMIEGDDDRRGDQDAPVAIERKECE